MSDFADELVAVFGAITVSPPPGIDDVLQVAGKRRRTQLAWLASLTGLGVVVLSRLLVGLRGQAPSNVALSASSSEPSAAAQAPIPFRDVLPTLIGDVWVRMLIFIVAGAAVVAMARFLRRGRIARPIATWIRRVLLTLFFLIVAVVGIRLSLEVNYAASESMQPAITMGSRMIIASHDTDVVTGDVVIHRLPVAETSSNSENRFVKRIIAVGGDSVQGIDGQLLVNGVPSVVLAVDASLPIRDFGPLEVPPNEYFLMGDNYRTSFDSRVHGTVAHEDLLGTVRWATKGWTG